MEGGYFLIDMQRTGPKLAIFHVFFGFGFLRQNVKKNWPLRLKIKSELGSGFPIESHRFETVF